EDAYVDNVKATAVATGLGIRDVETAQKVGYTTAVLPFSNDEEEAKKQAAELLDSLNPRAIISIEKLGPNAAGVTHSATGMASGPDRAQLEHLIYAARDRGIVTVGVGDNGN